MDTADAPPIDSHGTPNAAEVVNAADIDEAGEQRKRGARSVTSSDIDDAIKRGKQDAEQARAARKHQSLWAIAGGKGAIPRPTGPVREGPSRTTVVARGAGKRVSAATRAGIWHWTTKKRTTTRTIWRFLLFGTTGRPSGLQLSHAQRVAIGRKSITKRRRRSNGRLI
jgi:hypothetical protein